MNACLSFAVIDSNSLKLTPLSPDADRIQPFKVIRSLVRFSSSSQSVLRLPSKSNPSNVFVVLYTPSPFFSFFSDIGSLLSTILAGNMS
jgi:hypothetical protein